jgi:RNA polymerase sigma-70 factor (ECF subfamily)
MELCEDMALVGAMVEGDPHAWREFQGRFSRLIVRCITKVTRRFSAISADDVQEIYATLIASLFANDCHKLRTFNPSRGSRLASWIGLLAMHCTYDYLRGLRREPAMGSLCEAYDVPCEEPDPFESTASREHAAMLGELFDTLTTRDQHFAELYFGEGLAPDEIAERMNISVKTVYSKKHKIQTRLGAVLALSGAPAYEPTALAS